MTRRQTSILAIPLLFAALAGAEEPLPSAPAQVLLQGPDPVALIAALEAAGGILTHRLPIINAVGGLLTIDALDALADQPGVVRVIEDLNPPPEPEPRTCEVAGDLDTVRENKTLIWRLHNFADTPQVVQSLSLSWPESAGPVEISIGKHLIDEHNPSDVIGHLQPGETLLSEPAVLMPGVTGLALSFPEASSTPTQNELSLSLELDDCAASLPKSYPDNHGDFYFPSVVGADLLQEAGLTGNGVTVAVIDSGLWEHPALTLDSKGKPRIPEQYNAILDSPEETLIDLGGHGSHMSSIIANSERVSRAGAKGFKGIAPDIDLVPVKAFAEAGDGDFLDIIRGIQWVVDHRERLGIRVLNMSLSASPRFQYWDDPINQAVLRAWQAGIVVVAAAGNDGPEWGSIGSPGNNPYVITVGAITDSWTPDDRSDDYIPDFSSRGPTPAGHLKPDVSAPGGHITGLVPPDSRLARENPNFMLKTGEFVSTGSSQAAAVVSGIVALLLEANPDLSNDDVKCLLSTSAEPAINRDGRLAYNPFTQGSGYVNAGRALTLGSTQCDQQNLDIDAAVAGLEKLYGPAEKLPDGSPTLPGLKSLLSQTPTEKGPSANRRWGAREHLERLDPASEQGQASGVPADWAATLKRELDQLDALSRPATKKP